MKMAMDLGEYDETAVKAEQCFGHMSYDLFVFPDRLCETIVLIQDLTLDWQHFTNSWSPVCKIDVMATYKRLHLKGRTCFKDLACHSYQPSSAVRLASNQHTIVTHVRTAANI